MAPSFHPCLAYAGSETISLFLCGGFKKDSRRARSLVSEQDARRSIVVDQSLQTNVAPNVDCCESNMHPELPRVRSIRVGPPSKRRVLALTLWWKRGIRSSESVLAPRTSPRTFHEEGLPSENYPFWMSRCVTTSNVALQRKPPTLGLFYKFRASFLCTSFSMAIVPRNPYHELAHRS